MSKETDLGDVATKEANTAVEKVSRRESTHASPWSKQQKQEGTCILPRVGMLCVLKYIKDFPSLIEESKVRLLK